MLSLSYDTKKIEGNKRMEIGKEETKKSTLAHNIILHTRDLKDQ